MSQSSPLPVPAQAAPGLGASLAALMAQMRRSAPAPVLAAARPALRLASYNVHKCVGRDGRYDPARILRVIGELDADILALQETDRRFGDRAGLLDLARLAEETGLVPVPVQGLRQAQGWHGNLLLYRRARLQHSRQIRLPGLEPRGAIMGDFCLGRAAPLRVIAAHFGLLRHSRTQQAALLGGLMAEAPGGALLMGDLNEWRIDRRVAVNRLGDHPSAASFPAGRPLLALDRIIPGAGLQLGAVRAHDTALARVASDHLPVTGQLLLD